MTHQIVIEPHKKWLRLNIKELYQARELIGFLAWRDIIAQYKQAVFGVGWAVIKPVLSVLIYTLVFANVAKLSSSGVPYPLFTLSGLVAWDFFSAALNQSTVSLIYNSSLITKVYFPRLVIPLASLGSGAVSFSISFFLFIVLSFVYGIVPPETIVFFPLFLLMGTIMTLGIGLFFSAFTVRYRDVAHAVVVLSQWWFWITPVAYGLENIQGKLKLLFYLNPMTWIIQGFRWSLLGTGNLDWRFILGTACFSLFIFIMGLFYFKKMEGYFADII